MTQQEITLRVPGKREYVLVLRLALGGVAVLKDLDAGTLDDLRNAADEACDCLLHQGRPVEWLELSVQDGGSDLMVSLSACHCPDANGRPDENCEDETEISRAVLGTLIPEVRMTQLDCGCVTRIDMRLRKAVVAEA